MRDGSLILCNCYFCLQNKVHPDKKYHQEYRKITSILKKAESLDPNDYIHVEACVTCSHTREINSEPT